MRRWSSLPDRLSSFGASTSGGINNTDTVTDNNNNDTNDNDPDNNNDDPNANTDVAVVEMVTIEVPGLRSSLRARRATIHAPPPSQPTPAQIEEEINLQIIYRNLNEAFGVDFGLLVGEGSGFFVDAEVETVATTCTDGSSRHTDVADVDTIIDGLENGRDFTNDDIGNTSNTASTTRTLRASNQQHQQRQRQQIHSSEYALDPITGAVLPIATPVIPEGLFANDAEDCKLCCRFMLCVLIFVGVVAGIVILLYHDYCSKESQRAVC